MAHVRNHEGAVLDAKVGMWKEGQHSNDLVLVSKCCDERAHRFTPSQVMEQLEFVLNPNRAACNIYLLQRHEARLLPPHRFALNAPPFGGRAGPGVVLGLIKNIPVVPVVVIQQVFCLVYRGEGACSWLIVSRSAAWSERKANHTFSDPIDQTKPI
jgi:hypothetical protein